VTHVSGVLLILGEMIPLSNVLLVTV